MKAKALVPPFQVRDWGRCLADLQIMLRIMHEISSAMLSQDAAGLFKQLHDMQCYCERFKDSIRGGRE